MTMKNALGIFALSFLFVLTGCQNQTATKSRDSTKSAETAQSTMSERQYGRDALSDGADTNAKGEATRILTPDADSIIIYFSRSGNTEQFVQYVQEEIQADVLELEITEPYPLNYEETVSRATQERDSESFPDLKTGIPELNQYSKIYIGSPVWSMTLSNPIIRFLEEYGQSFDGKELIPFSTNAGYGEGRSVEKIQELAPKAVIKESLSIQDEEVVDSKEQILAWLEQVS